MELGDLLVKIANNQSLTPQELDVLRRTGNETQQRNSFVAGNTNSENKLDIKFPIQPFYSEVLQTDQSSLSIKIPGGYKHLIIMGSGRINGSGGQDGVFARCQFNNDTTSTNYQWGHLYHIAGAVSTTEDFSDPSSLFWYFAGDGEATGGYAGSAFVVIPHYTSSYYKMLLTYGAVALSAATTTAVRHGVWKSVNPIQSIQIFPDPAYPGAKLEAGSLISVYGLL